MSRIAEIAARIPGYAPQDLPVDAVNAFLQQLIIPVGQAQALPLLDAHGRVLAEDVVSPIDVPGHDNAAMDGYAFAGDQLHARQSLQLQPLPGSALAGQPWQGRVQAGQCVKIMTGAVMPTGTDTVVPRELVRAGDGGSIAIAADALRPGANRRLHGEDIARGSVALEKGELLTPAAIGLLASLGLEQAPVLRPLRVALLSTGSEILRPGEAPREGAIHDSNRYTLHGLLTRMGVQVLDLGCVPDDPALLRAAFLRGAREADAVITSGGAGMGDADHTRTLLQELGEMVFWQIAMRPGRPMAVGVFHSKFHEKMAVDAYPSSAGSYHQDSIFFALPGNPVAAMVAFIAFVRPALRQMMGCRHSAAPLLRACATEPLRKMPGRTEYQRGIVSESTDGVLQVRSTGPQGAGVLSSMVRANGLIVLEHARGTVQPGEMVNVMMFDGAF
ncbi:MAG: molybdopterin molybdenumtransferase MoeA [Comamonas sp. SCN 65-56]|uniref:molybdopterin molybdotransferase MoeA n=1 Tax=Comamonas sp. SCN 65-56 TaxID=1660095 RepID=UPI000868725A|nr:gephyrin-like molybdotransferase Glp [Comamonas sp. SCN 65-56]ODS92462.1 MAG: molybdopterin molybdenumtransferase MoeA [Comamonas sp. SCN 65-56]